MEIKKLKDYSTDYLNGLRVTVEGLIGVNPNAKKIIKEIDKELKRRK